MTTLIGHYNAFGDYPAPVVPILQSGIRGLFACYEEAGRFSKAKFPPQAPYVAHAPPLVELLGQFNPQKHRLFAFSETDVAKYAKASEVDFFRDAIQRGLIAGANPFLLISIANEAADQKLLALAAKLCIAELGGVNEFSDNWYQQHVLQYPLGRRFLPPSVGEFVQTITFVVLGCSWDKRAALQKMTGHFNSITLNANGETVPLFVVNPLDNEELEYNVREKAIDVVAPATPEWLSDRELYFDGFSTSIQGELVLAWNPHSRSRRENIGWSQVLSAEAESSEFSWIRPRSGTRSGMLVDYALMTASGGLRSLLPSQVSESERRVVRYINDDVDTIAQAVWDGAWKVDAFVAQRHAIYELLDDLAPEDKPIIFSDSSEPLFIENRLIFIGPSDSTCEGAFREFAAFLHTLDSELQLQQLGLVSDQESVPYEHAAEAAIAIGPLQRPVALSLVVDLSDSMKGDKLDAAKLGLSALLASLRPERRDVAGLLGFSDEVEVLVPLSRFDQFADEIALRITRLQTRGRTALYDAILHGCQQLLGDSENIGVLIVLTDGIENCSTTTLEQVETTLKSFARRDRFVFALAYGADADLRFLEHCASLAGGKAYSGTIANIARLLRTIGTLI
jgi:uncharacterized protein YegL